MKQRFIEFLSTDRFCVVVSILDAFFIALVASVIQWLIAFSFVGVVPVAFTSSVYPFLGVLLATWVGFYWLRSPGVTSELLEEIEDFLESKSSETERGKQPDLWVLCNECGEPAQLVDDRYICWHCVMMEQQGYD